MACSPRLMADICERMVLAGLPLWRCGIFVRTLHPDVYGRNFVWRPGAEVEVGRWRGDCGAKVVVGVADVDGRGVVR